MFKKRLPDMLSVPVKAAAAANPIYSFASDAALRWSVPGGDAAIRIVISKLYWGDIALQSYAISGWERFNTRTGIYAESDLDSYQLLVAKAHDAEGFYRHVAG